MDRLRWVVFVVLACALGCNSIGQWKRERQVKQAAAALQANRTALELARSACKEPIEERRAVEVAITRSDIRIDNTAFVETLWQGYLRDSWQSTDQFPDTEIPDLLHTWERVVSLNDGALREEDLDNFVVESLFDSLDAERKWQYELAKRIPDFDYQHEVTFHIAPDVPVTTLSTVFYTAGQASYPDYAFTMRGPDAVLTSVQHRAQRGPGVLDPADADRESCFHLFAHLSRSGAYLVAHGLRSKWGLLALRPGDAPAAPPLHPWHGRVLQGPSGSCPTIPRTGGSLQSERLHEMLESWSAGLPLCDPEDLEVVLLVDRALEWKEVAAFMDALQCGPDPVSVQLTHHPAEVGEANRASRCEKAVPYSEILAAAKKRASALPE